MIRVLEEMVPMRDGIRLASDVFVADGPGGPGPAMLMRTPYGRAHEREEFDPVALARMGWNVVIQDVRGRPDSEGTFDPFIQEIDDGADSVAWCRSQPWCDGRVATMGRSYVGSTALLAAGHSVVDACSPQLTAGDVRDGWMYENGILRQGFVEPWSAGLMGGDPGSEVYRRWQSYGDEPYWRRISFNRLIPRVNTAMFHVAGWFDIFCEGSLDLYRRMAAEAPIPARHKQRLLVGPWTHTELFNSQTDEVDFGLAADGRLAMTQMDIAAWMLGAISGDEAAPGARVFLMGEDRWLDLDGWPPPSESSELFLTSEGALSPSRPMVDGSLDLAHQPSDPVPTWGGRSLGPLLPWAGPKEQSIVEGHPGVLSFTSAPLPEDLVVVGEVRAVIHASSSGRTADVIVKLIDVHPDGRGMSVIDAGMRKPIEPGASEIFDFTVGSVAMTFKARHRIRVQVAGSNHPRLQVDPHEAIHTILMGGNRASFIEIPSI